MTTIEQPHLIMVYNADGGLFSAVSDAVHKAVSPATYPCSLCAVTYGLVSMKNEWRRWVQSGRARVTFHHRDDFAAAWPDADFALPVILIEDRGRLGALVTASELRMIEDVPALIALIELRLPQVQRV